MTMVFNCFHEDEVNRSDAYFLLPSGKGVNVARVIGQLGGVATVFTHLGGNRVDEFMELCGKEHITLLSFPSESPIRTCTTLVNQERKTSTELVEEPFPVEEAATERAMDLFLAHVDAYDAVVFTGTKAKGYADDLFPRMVSATKKAGKIVVMDVKGMDLLNSLPCHPDVVKPNLSELIATFQPGKVVWENEASEGLYDTVSAIAENIYHEYQTKLVLSRGKHDTWVYDGLSLKVLPNVDVPVVNTIGCGDALTAGMIVRMLQGDDLVVAVKFGMACALKNAQSLRHGIL